MNDLKALHRRAMEQTDLALAAAQNGDKAGAQRFFREAYELESQAAAVLADDHDAEPTRSVLLRSAASLAFDCARFEDSRLLILTAFAGNPPAEIAEELQQLLKQLPTHRSPRASIPRAAVVRILLLDNNENGLRARKAVLEEQGYRLTAVTDPREAVELVSKEDFDLIITDYKMPQINGIDVIAKIKSAKPDLPVILLSGYVESMGMTEESTGADAVIQKNANEVQQLVRTTTRLLRKRMVRKAPVEVLKRKQRLIPKSA